MADSSAIRAGRAFVEAYLDSSKLDRGLLAAIGRLKAFGASISSIGMKLAGIGALGLVGLGGTAKAFADMGSTLKDAASRTGFAVEELSALKFAAEQSGASFEDLEHAIKFMQKGGWGHTAEDFMRLTDEIAAMPDAMDRTQEAVKVFGRGGTAMLAPIMDGFREMTDEARRAGLVMSKDDAEAADKLGDAWHKLTTALKFLVATIGQALAPVLTELIGTVMPIISGVVAWIKENKGLVVTILAVAAGMVAGGLALVVFGQVVQAVLATILAMGAAFMALLSPIGLTVLAIIGLGAAFLYLTDIGAQVRAGLAAIWADISATAKTTWGGIVDAVAAGDLALAGRIAMAGLKLAWLQGTEGLRVAWVQFTSWLEGNWIGTVSLMKLAWVDFSEWVANLWNDLTGELAKSFVHLGFKVGLISQADATDMVNDIDRQTADEKKNRGKQGADIAADYQRQQADLEKRKQDRLAGIGDEIRDAQAELDALVAEAKNKRALAGLKGKGIENIMQRGVTGSGVGTFSAAGALVMGGAGSGIVERLDKLIKGQDKVQELLGDIEAKPGAKMLFW